MSAVRKFHPMIVAAAAIALLEPSEGDVIEAVSPLTIEGEPHCTTCGSIMKCVDSETYGTDRVELRWVCPNRDSDVPVFTTESVWREPENGFMPPRHIAAQECGDHCGGGHGHGVHFCPLPVDHAGPCEPPCPDDDDDSMPEGF